MTIKNHQIKALIESNRIIKGNTQLKSELPKALMNVLAAQKNIKTLASKEKDLNDNLEVLKREVAEKDEKGQPKIITDEQTKQKRYEIPEARQSELMVAINTLFEEEVDVHLAVFSNESGDAIIKYLNDPQSTVFLEFLLEKDPEDEKKEVVMKKLEPTGA